MDMTITEWWPALVNNSGNFPASLHENSQSPEIPMWVLSYFCNYLSDTFNNHLLFGFQVYSGNWACLGTWTSQTVSSSRVSHYVHQKHLSQSSLGWDQQGDWRSHENIGPLEDPGQRRHHEGAGGAAPSAAGKDMLWTYCLSTVLMAFTRVST